MERIKAQLNGGRVDLAVAGLKPHRDRDEAVEACVRCTEANKDRMRCDIYRKRGLPVGSGVVESACKRIVGSRVPTRWFRCDERNDIAKRPRGKVLRARRRCLRWSEEDRRPCERHRWQSEGFRGEANIWHGLGRVVRRGLGNIRI